MKVFKKILVSVGMNQEPVDLYLYDRAVNIVITILRPLSG